MGSAQEQWLENDLATAPTNNIIAHLAQAAVLVVGTLQPHMQPLWQALYEDGADLVLGGHWHNYERLAPTDANGARDPIFGVRQFVVGTGGVGRCRLRLDPATSEVRNNTTRRRDEAHTARVELRLAVHPDRGPDVHRLGNGTVHGAPTGPLAPANDFNGDGKSDVSWSNVLGRELPVVHERDADRCSAIALLTVADQAWKVYGTGDYNGDGKADVLWRNSTSGDLYVWLMNGAAIASSGSPGTVADLNWKIVGSGDYNADGKSDILWRNASTGENYLWLMNGTSLASAAASQVSLTSTGRLPAAATTTATARPTSSGATRPAATSTCG